MVDAVISSFMEARDEDELTLVGQLLQFSPLVCEIWLPALCGLVLDTDCYILLEVNS